MGALLTLIGMLKYGVSLWPGWPNLFEAATNWQDPTVGSLSQPPQDYILASSATSLLLGALNLTSQGAYIFAQVLITLIAVLLPFLMPESLKHLTQGRLLFLMLAGGPVLAILLTNIAGYDALTVIAMTVAVFASRPWFRGIGWFFVGLNHSALGIFALLIWAAISASENLGRRHEGITKALRNIVVPLMSTLFGTLLMWLVTQRWGGITSRWEVFRIYEASYYFDMAVAGMPLILFSALGIGWVILLDRDVIRRNNTKVLLLAALIASAVLPLMAVDQTRTVAIVLFPGVLLWTTQMRKGLSPEIVSKLWRRYAVVAAVVPVVVILLGQPDPGTWQNFLSWRANLQ